MMQYKKSKRTTVITSILLSLLLTAGGGFLAYAAPNAEITSERNFNMEWDENRTGWPIIPQSPSRNEFNKQYAEILFRNEPELLNPQSPSRNEFNRQYAEILFRNEPELLNAYKQFFEAHSNREYDPSGLSMLEAGDAAEIILRDLFGVELNGQTLYAIYRPPNNYRLVEQAMSVMRTTMTTNEVVICDNVFPAMWNISLYLEDEEEINAFLYYEIILQADTGQILGSAHYHIRTDRNGLTWFNDRTFYYIQIPINDFMEAKYLFHDRNNEIEYPLCEDLIKNLDKLCDIAKQISISQYALPDAETVEILRVSPILMFDPVSRGSKDVSSDFGYIAELVVTASNGTRTELSFMTKTNELLNFTHRSETVIEYAALLESDN